MLVGTLEANVEVVPPVLVEVGAEEESVIVKDACRLPALLVLFA